MNTLSDTQQQAYRRDGFLLIQNAVPADLLQEMQETTRALIDASRNVTENNDVYDLDRGHRSNHPRLNRIKTPHQVADVYQKYLQSDALLNLLKPLLGNAIRLHNSKLNTKAAQGGAPVEWHQDWAFYPHTNDDLLAVGVMLSDIGEDDGPLQVIPGSHKLPAIPHMIDKVFCGAVDPNHPDVDLDAAVTLTGKAGDISIHHVRTLHGSAPNRGKDPRLLLLYELGAADAWPIAGAQNVYTGMNQQTLWQKFQDNLVCGSQPLTARLTEVPIMMPLPPPPDGSSIFKVQESGKAKSAFTK